MFNLNCDLFNVMVFCLMLLKFHSDGSENNFLRNPIKYRDLDVYRPSEERLTDVSLIFCAFVERFSLFTHLSESQKHQLPGFSEIGHEID